MNMSNSTLNKHFMTNQKFAKSFFLAQTVKGMNSALLLNIPFWSYSFANGKQCTAVQPGEVLSGKYRQSDTFASAGKFN